MNFSRPFLTPGGISKASQNPYDHVPPSNVSNRPTQTQFVPKTTFFHNFTPFLMRFGIGSTGPRALAGHQPAPPALWGGRASPSRAQTPPLLKFTRGFAPHVLGTVQIQCSQKVSQKKCSHNSCQFCWADPSCCLPCLFLMSMVPGWSHPLLKMQKAVLYHLWQ